MKRLLIIFSAFFLIESFLAIFVGMSFFMLGIFFFHLATTSGVFNPRIAKFIVGNDKFENNRSSLLNRGKTLHFRLYWLFSNLAWLGITFFLFTFHNFRLIDGLRNI
jgi:hypothetical protein